MDEEVGGSSKDLEDMEMLTVENTSSKHFSNSDDSISQFEKNMRILLLDLHTGSDSTEQPHGTRRSERPKKLPS